MGAKQEIYKLMNQLVGEGRVVLDGVDFGYNDDKMVLYDIRLFAEPGQKIAFVGSTGAGKTTITNLINRFYDIQDGINITKIKKPDLRHSLRMVLQDTHLFTGTVIRPCSLVTAAIFRRDSGSCWRSPVQRWRIPRC